VEVAVYDPKSTALEETRRQITKTFGSGRVRFQATTDLDAFWGREDIDAVSVCSPDHLHCFHVCTALERGWHVLCEKPMATTSLDAEKMMATAKKANRKLMVHHQMRYLPVFEKSKDFVADGKLGVIFSLEADYCHDMRERATEYDDWRVQEETHQEIVLGGGSHPIDLMQWIVEDQIVEVFSYANHLAFPSFPDVDTAIAVLRFRSGSIGRVTVSFGTVYPGTRHSLTVFGTNGTLIDGLFLGKGQKAKMTSVPTQYRSREENWLGELLIASDNLIHYPYDHNEHDLACESLISDFINCILSDSLPPIPPSESADAIRVCEAIIQSYRTGTPATVKR